MNVWKESYPESLEALVLKAKEIAENTQHQLAAPNCKRLNELYQFENNKVRRQSALFNSSGYISNTKNNKLNEFRGLYIFGEEVDGIVTPVYVGISRTVFRRLRQHGWGKNHNECTFAYLMANEEHFNSKFINNREQFPQAELEASRTKVKSYKVVLHPVDNDYELYFLEVALSAILKTKWNSFRTH